MQEMCAIFGVENQFVKRQVCSTCKKFNYDSIQNLFYNLQEFLRQETERLEIPSFTKHVRREEIVVPRKRKLDEMQLGQLINGIQEVTEMYCPFIRGHYADGVDIPKT